MFNLYSTTYIFIVLSFILRPQILRNFTSLQKTNLEICGNFYIIGAIVDIQIILENIIYIASLQDFS